MIILFIVLFITIILLLIIRVRKHRMITYSSTIDIFNDIDNLAKDIKHINHKLNAWLILNQKNPEIDTVKYIKEVIEDLDKFYDKINF